MTCKDNFLTTGQLEMQKTAKDIAKRKQIKFIESPHGTGLAFSLARLSKRDLGNTKIVHVDCLIHQSARKLFVTILRHSSNIRFSNLNYLSVDVHSLLLIVKERLAKDLKEERVLLVIDHVDSLNKTHIALLAKLLKFANPPCGILIRSTTSHRLKLYKEHPRLHDEFYLKLTNENSAVIPMTSMEERLIFIKQVQGVNDEDFAKDLAKPLWGFSKMLVFIERWRLTIATR